MSAWRRCAAIAVLVVLPGAAFAQYPQKAIDLVMPFAAGGSGDVEGRILARQMSKLLGVQVVPINKPGAAGAAAYVYVKNALADGYTIGWNGASILTTTNIGRVPFMFDALDHVGRVETQPVVFAVSAESPWQSFEEFVKDCRKKPRKLKIGYSGNGSLMHLAGLAITKATRCRAVLVPQHANQRNSRLLSGKTHATTAPLSGVLKLARSGRIRVLAHLSANQDDPVLQNIPTLLSLGHDVSLDAFQGLSVPKETPEEIRATLFTAMFEAAQSQEFRALARQKGFTISPQTGEEFTSYLQATDKVVKSIMRQAGLFQSRATK